MKRRDLAAALVLVAVIAAAVLYTFNELGKRTAAVEDAIAIQGCSSEYAATYDAHFGKFLEAALAAGPYDGHPPQSILDRLATEAAAVPEMAARRIGLAAYATEHAHDFECLPLPNRLVVEGIDPTDPAPPAPSG